MGLLFSHNMAAMYFNNPAIILSDGEAAAMAEAGKNVARHYPVVEKFSPEAQDWVNLIMVAGAIYGAKMMGSTPAQEQQTAAVVPDAQMPHATPGDTPIILPEVVAQKQPASGNVQEMSIANSGNATYYPDPVTPGDAYVQ